MTARVGYAKETRVAEQAGAASVRVVMRSEDRDDMSALYERYAPLAHRLSFVLLGDQDEASDVVQDAFIRLFGRFRNIRRLEAFEWYLRRTVINLCRDRQRKHRAERTRDARMAGLANTTTSEPVELGSVIDTLRMLPHRQQVALVLRYLEDLSVAETATVMRCSESAVKSLVNRGKESLREMARGETWG